MSQPAKETRVIELDENLHQDIEKRLAAVKQRYTSGRRQVVEALAATDHPLDVPAILAKAPDLPMSSAYRTLNVLALVGVVRRITGADDSGFYELSEELVGGHHHHAMCERCGKVADIESSPALEKALDSAVRIASENTGFTLDSHRIDLVGLCDDCI